MINSIILSNVNVNVTCSFNRKKWGGGEGGGETLGEISWDDNKEGNLCLILVSTCFAEVLVNLQRLETKTLFFISPSGRRICFVVVARYEPSVNVGETLLDNKLEPIKVKSKQNTSI